MIPDIRDKFETQFGQVAVAFGVAPGRVNLIGEHIDYNGGTVLPTALSKQVNVAVAPNTSNKYHIFSEGYDTQLTRPVGDPAIGHWSDGIVGATAKAAELGLAAGGFDIYVTSSIPAGAGVSSSAALMTALLRAYLSYADVMLGPVALAKAARAVENDYIGVPCGVMDQMAVGLTKFSEALALDTKTLATDIIPIPENWRFVVIHSGISRALSDGRYEARFKECAEAAQRLGIEHLCDATLDMIETLPTPQRDRTKHVVSEHARVLGAINALNAADAPAFGKLMNESHASYTDDFSASAPEIDALVRDSIDLGALGARLTGGGFGGCTVSLLMLDQIDAWREALLQRHPNAWLV